MIASVVLFIYSMYMISANGEIERNTEWKYDYDEENQIVDIHVYKDGEYSHTVKAHYFTRAQIDKIRESNEGLGSKKDI